MGLNVVNSLADLPSTVDRNDVVAIVFRRPTETLAVVEDAKKGNITAVWFQLGVAHPDAVAKAKEYGMDVVEEQCFWVEFRKRRKELGI